MLQQQSASQKLMVLEKLKSVLRDTLLIQLHLYQWHLQVHIEPGKEAAYQKSTIEMSRGERDRRLRMIDRTRSHLHVTRTACSKVCHGLPWQTLEGKLRRLERFRDTNLFLIRSGTSNIFAKLLGDSLNEVY